MDKGNKNSEIIRAYVLLDVPRPLWTNAKVLSHIRSWPLPADCSLLVTTDRHVPI
jgi:hypothetical protein